MPDKPVSGGRHDENQRLAGVQRSSKPPERDAGAVRRSGLRARRRSGVRDLRWATVGLDFSEERSWTSPKRGPVAASRGGRCQPGLTIAELRSGHVSSGRRDRSPSLQGKPWETAPEPKLKCYCLSTRRPRLPESTLGVMRRHADQVCVVGARGRLAGKGDLVGETGNPRVGARARPEGKIASVTIAGRTGDLLF